jgi:hypothetical protein
MSSSTTLTGREGEFLVGGVAIRRVTQWAVNPTLATSSEWGDSDSCGYTNRAAGRFDATFTAEGKYDTAYDVWDYFMPGDIVAAQLHLDHTTTLLSWYFPRALCSDFNMTVDVDTEEVIGWTSSWGADGIFYKPGYGSGRSAARGNHCA